MLRIRVGYVFLFTPRHFRAAKFLGVQQSTVSRRVRALEDVRGVSLFEGHRTGVRVTNAEARYFGH